MTVEELREHCEKQVKMCEEWAKGNDRKPSGKIYEEHKLILDLIKALEQQPCDDCVSLQAIINMTGLSNWFESSDDYYNFVWELGKLPPVTPTQKWIPVSEELPKRNMPCLVAVGDFNLTQIAMYSDLMGTIDHKIFWQGDYGHENFSDITKYVKAWMPLPKPYEEKRGSENGNT